MQVARPASDKTLPSLTYLICVSVCLREKRL